jgi:nicotinamidase/pyrazinamidase
MGDKVDLVAGDALIVTDIQYDFLPGGSLAVKGSDEVIPLLNRYIASFQARGLPIFATRDWHPPNHSSFHAQGGPWPPHCVQGTPGAAFSDKLDLPQRVIVISKATHPEREAYSSFEGTELNRLLQEHGIRRLFVGGLTTEYCILNTVKDALRNNYAAFFLEDAIRAVDVTPGDGDRAIEEMLRLGATPLRVEAIER